MHGDNDDTRFMANHWNVGRDLRNWAFGACSLAATTDVNSAVEIISGARQMKNRAGLMELQNQVAIATGG